MRSCGQLKVAQAPVIVYDLSDQNRGPFDLRDRYHIADALDGKSQNIETDSDVRYGSGSKRGGGVHSGAPKNEASLSKSENTPAAVTSGPAPGPRTIIG